VPVTQRPPSGIPNRQLARLALPCGAHKTPTRRPRTVVSAQLCPTTNVQVNGAFSPEGARQNSVTSELPDWWSGRSARGVPVADVVDLANYRRHDFDGRDWPAGQPAVL
jgi:hypothetical protein